MRAQDVRAFNACFLKCFTVLLYTRLNISGAIKSVAETVSEFLDDDNPVILVKTICKILIVYDRCRISRTCHEHQCMFAFAGHINAHVVSVNFNLLTVDLVFEQVLLRGRADDVISRRSGQYHCNNGNNSQ